jgi:hypothetical protein
MLRSFTLSVGLVVSFAMSTISHSCAQQESGPAQFPLAKGSYWIYEGQRKGQEAGHGPKVSSKKITCRTEVVDRIERAGVMAAVVRGYPVCGEDLKVLASVDGHHFYLLPAESSVLKRLKDPADALVDLVRDDQIELVLPLVKGERFCESSQMTRPDGFYCSVVEQQRREKLSGVSGVSGGVERTVYEITFRTLPDYTAMDFVPGVGITSYDYIHHGTIEEEHLKPVRFHDATIPDH